MSKEYWAPLNEFELVELEESNKKFLEDASKKMHEEAKRNGGIVSGSFLNDLLGTHFSPFQCLDLSSKISSEDVEIISIDWPVEDYIVEEKD